MTFDIARRRRRRPRSGSSPIQAAVAAVADRHGDVRVEQFGGTSADVALGETLDEDFQRAELLSIPITLAVLLLTFGALVAARAAAGLRAHRVRRRAADCSA